MRHSKSRLPALGLSESRFIGEHSDISELVEDADESAPVRLETAPTGLD